MAADQVRNEIESNKFQGVLEKEHFQEKPENVRFIRNQLFSVMRFTLVIVRPFQEHSWII